MACALVIVQLFPRGCAVGETSLDVSIQIIYSPLCLGKRVGCPLNQSALNTNFSHAAGCSGCRKYFLSHSSPLRISLQTLTTALCPYQVMTGNDTKM